MARDVIFRLKVEDDPRNKGVLGGFSQQIARLKAELDKALSGSGGRIGGGGPGGRGGSAAGIGGPNSDLKDRIKLAGQLLNQQIKDADKLAAKAKKDADTDLQYRIKLAGQLLNQQIRNADKLAATNRRNAEQAARDAIRDARRIEVETRRNQRLALATERRYDAATNRILRGGFGAIGQIGGYIGGDTGSALGNVALGGHVAHQTYEGAKGIVGGIGSLIGPRGANGLPLAAGSNAAVAAGTPVAAAGAAAIVAWLPALAMAIRGATIAIQGSESSASVLKFKGGRLFDVRGGGTLGGAFGEGVAGSSLNHTRFLARNLSDSALLRSSLGNGGSDRADVLGGGYFLNPRANDAAQANLELSNRALTRQQGQALLDVARRARLSQLGSQLGVSTYDAGAYALGRADIGSAGIGTASSLGAGAVGRSNFFSAKQQRDYESQFGDVRRQSALSNLELRERGRAASFGRPGLESQFRDYAAIYNNTSAPTEQRDQAEERLKQIRTDLTRIAREEQSIASDTARVRLTTAKQEYDLRKQMADEAEENYKSDAERFALSDPSQRAATRTAFSKLDAGAPLTKRDIEATQGYAYRRDDVRNATVKLAEQYGGDFLTSSREEAKRRRVEATTAKETFDKSTLELDNQFKIDVTLKSDASFEQARLKEFAGVFEQMDKAVADQMNKLREEFTNQINRFAGSRSLPGNK